MNLSIRKFLLLNLLLAITATTSLTAIGNYYLDQQDIQNNLDCLLSQAALSFQTLLGDDIKSQNLTQIQQNLNNIPQQTINYLKKNNSFDPKTDEIYKYEFQIWDSQGRLLLRSAGAPAQYLAIKGLGLSDIYVNGQPWRVMSTHDAKQGITYIVAEHYTSRNHFAHLIMRDDIYIMLLTYPLSGILIWIIIGSGLSSIGRVTNEVARRAADHLDPVDLESVPMEIKPLVDELNKLFLRLKQAFEREQRFSADAAHELRTPLAALRTQAQVALKTLDNQERQQELKNVIAGVDRCTHVIQQLLTLCRMSPESATLENQVKVDTQKIAAEVIAQLAPLAVAKKIEIELITNDKPCIIKGNATGIHALFRNLVDNAIRYTPIGGFIKVLVFNEKSHILIRVVDNGPGIPADLRARVFERFFRVLGTNAQGSGLGLAIVQQIVKLHHGTVVLRAPETGQGLEVEVIFPLK